MDWLEVLWMWMWMWKRKHALAGLHGELETKPRERQTFQTLAVGAELKLREMVTIVARSQRRQHNHHCRHSGDS